MSPAAWAKAGLHPRHPEPAEGLVRLTPHPRQHEPAEGLVRLTPHLKLSEVEVRTAQIQI